jgi:hypothetical protein
MHEVQETMDKEKEVLRKRVNSLIRRKRLMEVQNLVKQDETKPWSRGTQAKVCSPHHFFLKWLAVPLHLFKFWLYFLLKFFLFGFPHCSFCLLFPPFYFLMHIIILQLGSRLIELLTETAYVQPPVNQSEDIPPDVRPAFRHIFKTLTKNPGWDFIFYCLL